MSEAALRIVRKVKRARGGSAPSTPHVGPIHSDVAGRTDHLALDVPAGSYVVAADVVSGLGQGNTAAGLKILSQRFPAKGISSKTTPIMAAGGEYVIPPEEVAKLGDGDMERGHAILDRWMVNERKKIVDTMSSLPGPAQD